MSKFSTSPKVIITSFWNNIGLIDALVRREVIGRYKGSTLGLFWSFFNPIFMLIIYTFVFSVVFKMRWDVASDSRTEFALILFAGLIVFNFFAECLNRAPTLILSNVNYVKKVVFPLEILPWVSLGNALFHAVISVFVWLLAYLILFGIPHLTILWLPIVVLPLIVLLMGVSWMLSSLGVFIRDIAQLVGMFTSVLMFLSPIFYPVSALPEKYQKWLMLNPMASTIEQVRDVLYWGTGPDLFLWVKSMGVSFIVLWIGFFWFQKSRQGFADVL